MNTNQIHDSYTQSLADRVKEDGLYVLGTGFKTLALEPQVDLETPFVIGCSAEQAHAVLRGELLVARLYSPEGVFDITGEVDESSASFRIPKISENYWFESAGYHGYLGDWEGCEQQGKVAFLLDLSAACASQIDLENTLDADYTDLDIERQQMEVRKMRNGKIAAATLAALVGVVGVPYCASQVDYSHGDRVGTVHKLSEKGFVFKTYEGQMGLDAGDSTAVGRGTWGFSITDDNLAKRVKDAMDTGQKVRISYDQKLWVPFWIADTSYLVTDVTLLGKK